MRAMLLNGHGGLEQLQLRDDVPMPSPAADEVLIRVAASSINNTDINTRTGWYAGGATTLDPTATGSGWGGTALAFPLIQGADIAGTIEAVGEAVDAHRIGERVIVQACLVSRAANHVSPWIGSEVPGAFAEYAVAPAADTYAIISTLTDQELGALPCAYGTASNMLEQAGLDADDRVLITGASGNVGLAAVQLARLSGAEVHAVAAPEKWHTLHALGVAACYPRDLADIPKGHDGFTLIVDLVGGDGWSTLLESLCPHGRLVISGAISGAAATLDLRKLYLNNWSLLGRTEQTSTSFQTLVDHVNAGRLKPLVHATYPLSQLAEAQAEFMAKAHVGKIVIDMTA